MDSLSNYFFGNRMPQNNPPRQDPSMRGGLPKVVDMLQSFPSYTFNRKDLEAGNKVLLSQDILHQLTNIYQGNLPHPMIFSVSTLRTRKTVYVGVLEFVAPEHSIILPFWLFRELGLNEGETIRLGIADFLPKANFVQIRPHKTAFIELPDPRAILEIHLRNFVCLTKNETITLNFMGNDYQLDILELKPESQYNTGIIIDTDLFLDFAPPLDYVEPKKPQPKQETAEIDQSGPFQGEGVRLDGRQIRQSQQVQNEDVYDPREHKINQGIRKEWFQEQSFVGKGQKIGRQQIILQFYNEIYLFIIYKINY